VASAIAHPYILFPSEPQAVRPPTESTGKIPLRIIVMNSLSEARQVLERLKKGEDFASLAAKISIDPSAKDGGYVGDVDPSGLRPELRDAVRGIGRGEVSSVVKIDEGYAIVRIDPEERPSAMGENSTALLALTGPGAIRYGPNVDGAGEVFAFFSRYPDKPKDWNRLLRPVTAAELRRMSLSSGIKHVQQMLEANPDDTDPTDAVQARFLLAQLHAYQGQMAEAIEQWKICHQLAQFFDPKLTLYVGEVLGIAYLHKSEMENDIYVAPRDRCLFPMSTALCYSKTADSEKAAEYLLDYLKQNSDDLEAKWLLNLTYRTLGKYPAAIPSEHLIPLAGFESKQDIGRFKDVAPEAGLKIISDGGGIIVDDFENRGLFDVVVSDYDTLSPQSLRYFHNNGDGTFTDQTERSGLSGQLCGLNMIQADYNNDGCLDILLLRGAWVYPQPLSLFRGNGDGTFTDITREAGLSPLVATQAAVWADINNDGHLDLFVGNEKGPSYLFLNKGDGTFEDISASSGVDRIAYTKGIVAADYDNDGYVDFYVSNLGSSNFLYHNEGNNTFKEVAREAGVRDSMGRSFATWFFDYDNDGWTDLFVTSDYSSVDETLRTYLGLSLNAVTLKLYKNKRDGTFEDVSMSVGLNKVFMPMGANFGDVDNDGFLDIYLGTGNPSYGSLVPNVLLRNDGGREFVDITASSGTGELHKGHGISFADMGNSGHQDLLTVIGGATPGDKHAFRFFKNPGNANNWIRVKLVGVKSNRSAMDARIKVTVNNQGQGRRFIHRIIGSGGSFGANPLEQHIGLGPKARVEELEIVWPASKTRQVFSQLGVNQCIEIKEFATQYSTEVRPMISQGKRTSAKG
jgi:hypothetical protein